MDDNFIPRVCVCAGREGENVICRIKLGAVLKITAALEESEETVEFCIVAEIGLNIVVCIWDLIGTKNLPNTVGVWC